MVLTPQLPLSPDSFEDSRFAWSFSLRLPYEPDQSGAGGLALIQANN